MAIVFAVPSDGQFCMPDGSFSIAQDYNIWKTSGFFQITLGFGHLTFGEAKFTDIAFDMVVGRGGQTLLALVSYRIFKQYITSTMEVSPISYGTYRTIFIREGLSFMALIGLIYEFWSYQPLSSILAMVWMFLCASFIIAFPTLASAMTGYSSNGQAFILDNSGNYLDFMNLYLIDYVIQDTRISNYTACSGGVYNLTIPYLLKRPKNISQCYGYTDYNCPDCDLRGMISEYVTMYGFLGLNRTESRIGTGCYSTNYQKIASPSLNISAYYIDPGRTFEYTPYQRYNNYYNYAFGTDWIDAQTGQKPFGDRRKTSYTNANSSEILTLGDSSTQGRCQPDSTSQWGFSFMLLFICLVLLLVWTLGNYFMWLRARLSMRHHNDKEVAGGYTAMLELATAMGNDLRDHGEDSSVLQERSIRAIIKEDLRGGSMIYHSPLRVEKFRFRNGFMKWMKGNRWWFLAAIVSFICFLVPLLVGSYGIIYWRLFGSLFSWSMFAMFVFVGIGSGLLIGCQTNRSRTLMLAVWVVLGIIVAIAIGVLYARQ